MTYKVLSGTLGLYNTTTAFMATKAFVYFVDCRYCQGLNRHYFIPVKNVLCFCYCNCPLCIVIFDCCVYVYSCVHETESMS